MFDYTKKGKWWDIGVKVVQGCTRVSEACKNCWSLSMEHRFNQGTEITLHLDRLTDRIKKKTPMAFSIWNDLFHESVPFDFIDQIFNNMIKYHWHIYQILTKRPQNALKYFNSRKEWVSMEIMPLPNVWIGVTAENQERADERIPLLLQIPARIRFVSCEPLLHHVDGYIYDDEGNEAGNWMEEIDWIIAGAETGARKRETKKQWIDSLFMQCKDAGVPFFDKQNILGFNIYELPEYEGCASKI